MLHVTKKHKSQHGKIIAAEICVSVFLFVAFLGSAAQASDITSDMVIKLVNDARQSAKVAVLKKNEILSLAAEKKAEDMINNDYFAHNSPDGKTPWYWIDQQGYDYKFAGENLAINFSNAEEEQKAWMDSPLHRKNILNEKYAEIGVAVKEGVINGKKTTITVQMFGAHQGESQDTAAVTQVDDLNNNKEEFAGLEITGSEGAGLDSEKSVKGMFFGGVGNFNVSKENQGVLIGWFSLFCLALVIAIIDALKFFHEKSEKRPAYAVHITRH
jgi:uncharacterized protein YkwD